MLFQMRVSFDLILWIYVFMHMHMCINEITELIGILKTSWKCTLGKAQIYFTILLAEIVSESKETHYTKGGDLPTIVFPPVDFASDDAEYMEKQKSKELNNGRLAMIAIMSFCAAANIPGSVPALAGNPAF